MNDLWQSLETRFEELSIREKYSVLGCGLFTVVALLFTLVLEPKMAVAAEEQKQLSSEKLRNQQLEAESLRLQAQLKRDPDAEVDSAIANLTAESLYLSKQMSQIIEVLLTPSQMSIMLESVLSEEKDVKLLSLSTMKAEAMAQDQETAQYAGYYVHPVRMEIEGNYFSISRYLERLENLPSSYFWRDFHYKVAEYPKATLVFEVYTLGMREEFIGG